MKIGIRKIKYVLEDWARWGIKGCYLHKIKMDIEATEKSGGCQTFILNFRSRQQPNRSALAELAHADSNFPRNVSVYRLIINWGILISSRGSWSNNPWRTASWLSFYDLTWNTSARLAICWSSGGRVVQPVRDSIWVPFSILLRELLGHSLDPPLGFLHGVRYSLREAGSSPCWRTGSERTGELVHPGTSPPGAKSARLFFFLFPDQVPGLAPKRDSVPFVLQGSSKVKKSNLETPAGRQVRQCNCNVQGSALCWQTSVGDLDDADRSGGLHCIGGIGGSCKAQSPSAQWGKI